MDFPQIIKTTSTPSIEFSETDRTIHIDGESYPENSFEIYTPVLSWIKTALKEKQPVNLNVNVSYMNSSSTKCILDILDALDEAHSEGTATKVAWLYDPENERSRELAEEFKEEFTLPFEIIANEK